MKYFLAKSPKSVQLFRIHFTALISSGHLIRVSGMKRIGIDENLDTGGRFVLAPDVAKGQSEDVIFHSGRAERFGSNVF
ncbi:hypothetical protein CEXT_303251 [Caerostris extrusa]|uniref:Uncharacterized protein n=1 Tax=Caerostris extrusa TaxID=172846 RepID=A0AAV4WG75_CAEEX|nr:hypothetical protein CEXT_303251 [Caerostris extrusa]